MTTLTYDPNGNLETVTDPQGHPTTSGYDAMDRLRGLVSDRVRLVAGNLGLRQQLVALKRTTPRPKIRRGDRIFRVWLSRLWAEWRTALAVV